MEKATILAEQFASLVWDTPLVILLFTAGIIFSLFFVFPQIRLFWHSIMITMGRYDKPEDFGEISHFQALCAALSATIGLGNIAGVAVAISIGGPGAVFWMWVAAFLGMATKFTSISLALMYRTHEPDTGRVHGGPMYTIKRGLGKYFHPLAFLFSIFTVLSSIGAGNMFQSNQMASILQETAKIPTYVSGSIFAILTGLVLIGGIKRIGKVAEALVPGMVIIYFVGAIGILAVNYHLIPSMFLQIFHDAFAGTAAVGGFAGVAFKDVVIQGVRRAVFSNEAGLGSSAMAHCASKSSPIQEGIVGMLEPFIDTIVVCTLTALVLLITGAWANGGGLQGSELTAFAFATVYGPLGKILVTLTVVLFAFSTIISWSYYGEQGMVFLFGIKSITPYRYVFTVIVLIGAVVKLSFVLNFSDAVFGLMAIPNLFANIMLTPKLKKELKQYETDLKAGRV